MKHALFALLTLLAVVAFPVSGFCGTELSTVQVQTLTQIDTKIAGVHELAADKIITADEATAAESHFAQQAKAIVGHDVTPAEIKAIVSNVDKTEGLGVFLSICAVAAGIVVLIAVVGLISLYFKDLLKQIPPPVYEAVAYIGATFTAMLGYFWGPFHLGPVLVEPLWFSVPGALGLAGCLFLTNELHFSKEGSKRRLSDTVYAGPGFINFPTVMFGICTVAWGFLAVLFHHIYPVAGLPHVLAFGAVIALQAALGFSVVTMPGCIAMGWKSDAQVPRSVFSSFLILLAYVGLTLSGYLTGDLALFGPGAAFMGAFVYFLGLLVMSSKWYVWSGNSRDDEGNRSRYLRVQGVMLLSGLAAYYLGSADHMSALLGVGGTFFTIYLLEKYYEINWGSLAGYLWSLLGVGVFLYFFIGFANTHPQYFIWGIQ